MECYFFRFHSNVGIFGGEELSELHLKWEKSLKLVGTKVLFSENRSMLHTNKIYKIKFLKYGETDKLFFAY